MSMEPAGIGEDDYGNEKDLWGEND